MDYLKLELNERQNMRNRAIHPFRVSSQEEADEIDIIIEITRNNAILVLEDELKEKNDKKLELIIFDMEMDEFQIKKASRNSVHKMSEELERKIECREYAIAYICYRLHGMNEEYSTVQKMLKGLLMNENTIDDKAISRILNKFLLDKLKEEQKKIEDETKKEE